MASEPRPTDPWMFTVFVKCSSFAAFLYQSNTSFSQWAGVLNFGSSREVAYQRQDGCLPDQME